jgi:hypothetical protein
MEELEEDHITFDPSRDEVLGVFGDDVYVRIDILTEKDSEPGVLIISRNEYLRVWNNWLDGKKRYCESNNHFCGVMGYTFPEDYKLVESIVLNLENPKLDEQDESTWTSIPTKVTTYKVRKFEDHHDFEHG